MQLSDKQIARLNRLQSVKINGVELNDQERIYLCWLLKKEYSDLYMKMTNTISDLSFSRKQSKDEMLICLKLLSLVERSNKKWILELTLAQK